MTWSVHDIHLHTQADKLSHSFSSIALPEKLEHFANKYAEHAHEKWSAEKVRPKIRAFTLRKCVLNCTVFDLEQVMSVVKKKRGHLKFLSWKKFFTQNHQKSISAISKWKKQFRSLLNMLFCSVSRHCFLWWCLIFVNGILWACWQ